MAVVAPTPGLSAVKRGVGRPRKVIPEPVKAKKIPGRPFTVAHFRAWSKRFKLKGGDYFVLEGYQELFLEDLFARDEDGEAVFAELWLVVPEGNGKTTFFTLVVLYTIEFKPEAWVPVAASARDQAVDLTYRIAAGFVERNELEDRFRLHPGYRQIVHQESKGSAKIFASDAASGDGVDPTLAVIEELHRLAKMDLYETWAGKLDKSGGQLVVASTAGEPDGASQAHSAVCDDH
jgi:phage terminase large subunit-like protein